MRKPDKRVVDESQKVNEMQQARELLLGEGCCSDQFSNEANGAVKPLWQEAFELSFVWLCLTFTVDTALDKFRFDPATAVSNLACLCRPGRPF